MPAEFLSPTLDLMEDPHALWHKLTNKLFTLQLAIGYQGAAESDTSDVGAQIGHSLQHTGGWVGVKMGEFDHVLSNTGEHGCQTHKTVEGCHQLRQVGDFNTLSNGETCRRLMY